MALTFPLPTAEFADLLPLGPCVWRLQRFESVTRTADSKPWLQELADPRWRVRVTLGVMDHVEAAELQALIDMHGSARPFLLPDPRRPGPRLDPDGAILGAATPVLHSVTASGFAISGLPAGYGLRRGDLIGVRHPNVAHQAIYQVASAAAAANGVSVTPVIEVEPRPRPQAIAGNSVQLIRPMGLFTVDVDAFDPGEPDGSVQRGMRFEAVEAW